MTPSNKYKSQIQQIKINPAGSQNQHSHALSPNKGREYVKTFFAMKRRIIGIFYENSTKCTVNVNLNPWQHQSICTLLSFWHFAHNYKV